MIGYVAAHEAFMTGTFRSGGADDPVVDVIVDTGFVGHLTLPSSVIQTLRLPFLWEGIVRLADDSVINVGMFSATIHWAGGDRDIEVLAMGDKPLLGTLLLDGHTLAVEFSRAARSRSSRCRRGAPPARLARLFPFLARLLRISLTVR